LPRAARLASDILGKYGNAISGLTLIPSGGGVFEVSKNEKLIFSKKEIGRFPEIEEIFDLIA
jgi:selenoprotein W-related protein